MYIRRNAVGWFEIYVDDLERARAFYEAVFGVELTKLVMSEGQDDAMEMLMFPMEMADVPGSSGALVRMNGYGPSSQGTIVYFSCEDCAVEEGRVTAAGGAVLKSKEDIGEYGYASLVRDSEGNTIGLHSMH